MKKFYVIFCLLFLLFIRPSVSAKGIDGQYCFSDGYIAYEFGQATTDDASHVLYISFLGESVGTKIVELASFTVLGMLCSKNQVLMQSSTKTYLIQWDEDGSPTVTKHFPNSLEGAVIASPDNLGNWLFRQTPFETTIQLTPSVDGTHWALRLTHKFTSRIDLDELVISHQSTSELIKMNKKGSVNVRYLLFDGVYDERK